MTMVRWSDDKRHQRKPSQNRTYLTNICVIEYHHMFYLKEEETDIGLVYRWHPKKQQVRLMPLALWQEVARQLCNMLVNRVIQPSKSPWASPVVLVRSGMAPTLVCGLSSNELSNKVGQLSTPSHWWCKSKYLSMIDLASDTPPKEMTPHISTIVRAKWRNC